VDSTSWRWIFAINVPLVLATLWLVARAVPASRPRAGVRLDLIGAVLCAVGLAAFTFGLIQQPLHGWGSPMVFGPMVGGVVLFACFIAHELRTPQPMLPLALFSRRNFTVTNIETLAMYAGLGMLFFFLVVFLQQTADYSALAAGTATLPVTLVMFALSGRFGGLADRHGPRFFLAAGPLIAAGGLLLMQRVDENADYVSQLLPALLVFALGLSMTVAPLTATVLADADESNAGIASAVNNAVARVAGLLAIAAVGAAVAAHIAGSIGTSSDARVGAALAQARSEPLGPPPTAGLDPARARLVRAEVRSASVSGFHLGVGIGAALVALGGLLGAAGLRNPTCARRAEGCAGGQITGVPEVVAEAAPERAAA
jgi:MFS family permease